MTIALNVQGLWDNWQRSQRDHNILPARVAYYVAEFTAGNAVPAIVIGGIVFEGENARVRTSDGRHRLTAAHQLNRATIDAVDTDVARQARDLFGL